MNIKAYPKLEAKAGVEPDAATTTLGTSPAPQQLEIAERSVFLVVRERSTLFRESGEALRRVSDETRSIPFAALFFSRPTGLNYTTQTQPPAPSHRAIRR